MAKHPNNVGAIVIDANVAVALAAHEAGRDLAVTVELASYAALGYALYVPGAIVPETLFALCNKLTSGALTSPDHAAAVANFERFMRDVNPPPDGEAALILGAEQIRAGYGCSRSADGVYIALADELSLIMPTVLLTFDSGIPNQVKKNAPKVTVKLLS